jgi:hypothetical protein
MRSTNEKKDWEKGRWGDREKLKMRNSDLGKKIFRVGAGDHS